MHRKVVLGMRVLFVAQQNDFVGIKNSEIDLIWCALAFEVILCEGVRNFV